MSIPHTESLIHALLDDDNSLSIKETEKLMTSGMDKEKIILNAIEPAMEKLSA